MPQAQQMTRRASSVIRRTWLRALERPRTTVDLVRLGSRESGWWVAEDVLSHGRIAVCAGAGEDVTLDVELLARGLRVITVDPTPRAIEHVRRTVPPAHPGFTFLPVGLWNQQTTLFFHSPQKSSDVSHSVANLQRTTGGFEATVTTLDDVLARGGAGHLDFLKLDVEGAEPTVLRHLLDGGLRPRCICFEFDQPQRIRVVRQLLSDLRREGYSLERMERWNFTLVLH